MVIMGLNVGAAALILRGEPLRATALGAQGFNGTCAGRGEA
jgi:hypothetical protein